MGTTFSDARVRFLFMSPCCLILYSTFRLTYKSAFMNVFKFPYELLTTSCWGYDVSNLIVRDTALCLGTAFLRALCRFWALAVAGGNILLLTREPPSSILEGQNCSLGSTQSESAASLHTSGCAPTFLSLIVCPCLPDSLFLSPSAVPSPSSRVLNS